MSDIFKALAEADPFKSWWPVVLSIGFGVVMAIKSAMGGQACPSQELLTDRVIVVTNGTDEVCIEVAKECCARNATCVVLVCRDPADVQRASTLIENLNTDIRVDIRKLDDFSLESIRKFVAAIEVEFQAIDVLINNESLAPANAAATDTCFHNIYYGQLMLSIELVRLLRKADGGGRIINVLHESYATMNLTDVCNLSESTTATDSFARAQLALLAATAFLSQKLKENSCPVTINACTVGSIVKCEDSPGRKSVLSSPLKWLLMKTPKQGAQTILYLTVDSKLSGVSGELFDDCDKKPSPKALQDITAVQKLMTETEKLLNLNITF